MYLLGIGAGWHPAVAESRQELGLYYSEERFLHDRRQYSYTHSVYYIKKG